MTSRDPLPPVDPVKELEAKLMKHTTARPYGECFGTCWGNDGQGHDYPYPVAPQERA